MAANPNGVAGAIFNPEPTNGTGALNTLIGAGTDGVYGPVFNNPSFIGKQLPIWRIGAQRVPTANQAQACGYAGKVMSMQQNNTGAPIASGAAMPDGSINRSSMSCPPGGSVLAVAP